jgi:GNAT superfamily N-acetyltransferase
MGGDNPRTLVQVTEAYPNRRLDSGGHFTSVAEEQGRLVRIASLEIFERLPYPGNLSGREGYLLNVYVESDFRRRGLAGALVRDLVGVPAAKAWDDRGCTPAPAGAGCTRRRASRPERWRRWSSCLPEETGRPGTPVASGSCSVVNRRARPVLQHRERRARETHRRKRG